MNSVNNYELIIMVRGSINIDNVLILMNESRRKMPSVFDFRAL